MHHLQAFVLGFSTAKASQDVMRQIEIVGQADPDHLMLFRQAFADVPLVETAAAIDPPLAILRFTAGRLNSRKAFISPYLPKLVD